MADSGPEFSAPEGVPDSAPEGVQNPDSGNRTPTPHPERLPTPNRAAPRRSRRLRREYNPKTAGLKDGVHDGVYTSSGEIGDVTKHPDYERCCTSLVTDRMRNEAYFKENKTQFQCTLGKQQPPPTAARRSRKKREYKARLFRSKIDEVNQTLGSDDWAVPSIDALMKSDLAQFVHFAASECGFDSSVDSLVVNWIHPMMLAAKSRGNDSDSPDWFKAINGPFAQEYWEAACVEVETLEKMDAWDVVDRTPDMNVLPSTWAFKCKRFPDGLIKKFKARFCARGDRQIAGVDYFETYAPVVQWTTVRLMLILESLLDLKSK